jgi:hypothetical protein
MTIRRTTIEACVLGVLLGAGTCLSGCKNDKAEPHSNVTDPAPEPQTPPAPAAPAPSAVAPAAVEPATPEAPPRELAETDPEEIEGWRPAWWLEEPLKAQQRAMACAMGTNPELAVARSAAVDSARLRLTRFLGYQPGATEMKTDAVRLPTGQYRAFVLVQTTIK